MPANVENSAVATELEKISFHSNPKERWCQKCSNYCTIALVSQARKVMLKTLQVRLQQYMNRKFQMFKLGLEKPEEPEIKSPTSTGSLKKQENSRKTCTSDSWTMLKPLTVWITTNCGKFFKRCEYQTTLPASWKTCMHVKKQQLELDMEQWTCSKLGKEYIKAIYCHMQSPSYEMPGWMKHKLESRLPGKISITSEMQMTPPLRQKEKRN